MSDRILHMIAFYLEYARCWQERALKAEKELRELRKQKGTL